MKVFVNTEFTGRWPFGTAALVVARDAVDAAMLLREELRQHGLPQDVKPEQMAEIALDLPKAFILRDGYY